MSITEEQVSERPTAFRFNGDGQGYRYVGEMTLPSPVIHEPSAAMPPDNTEDGSWHMLLIPNGEAAIPMQWRADLMVWAPGLASGAFRVAFSCAYLAAVGWTYQGPA